METQAQNNFEIWPPYEAFYIESMLFCTISAFESITIILDWVESNKKYQQILFNKYSEDQILDNLQNIVLQGAAISRYFWPTRKGKNNIHKLRSEKLREAFKICENNPLKNRDLRNAIEHFDERLDKYLTQEIVGHIIPKYVGPKPDNDGVPIHIFRAFYTDIGEFILLGNHFKIEGIIREIIKIQKLLEKFSENGFKLK